MEPTRARRSRLGGSALEAFFGLLSGGFKVARKINKKSAFFCVTVVKFWVFGSSLEGLRGGQKQHPESADSRGDLLKI